MRSGNPILKEGTFAPVGSGAAMTVQGTVSRTLVLLLLAVAGAATVWGPVIADPTSPVVGTGILVGALGGLVVAMVTIFKRQWAPFTAPIYALLEGVFLGALSATFEARYPGIAIQAVGLTFGTCFALLALYKAGVLRATARFRRTVFAATGAIAVVYLASIVMGFFGMEMPLLHDSGPIGIGVSLVIVAVAALNLVLDFDLIESGAAQGAPKYMEWYGAFALMVTLVWLYLEILRLLSKLQRR
ncbi:Bax inhibitor-1/YccA family protein [Vulgatibacter sp.]|uniref:Bax inhibitor-1/YccA family protein n=1 Tax=Vulgatibacter sp. TaxID=1971226 RepID=UPI0035669BC9